MRLALLLLALSVAGCAGAPMNPSGTPCVALGLGQQFCLLPPTKLPVLTASHIVEYKHGTEVQSFLGQMLTDGHHFTLVTASLLGPTLFTVDFNGARIVTTPAEGPWHGDLLLALMELALADEKDLAPALKGLSLKQTPVGAGWQREVYSGERLLVSVDTDKPSFPSAQVRIEIPSEQVTVTLQPIPESP